MTLREHQSAFANDVMRLLRFAFDNKLEVTFGEVFRTQEQQALHVKAGRSKTMYSMHCKRLAIDINFFFNGVFIDDYTKSPAQLNERRLIFTKLAEYWESLDKMNTAGFRWGWDDNHFERTIK